MSTFIVRFVSNVLETVEPRDTVLTERQRKCLEYVREHGGITSSEYQSLVGVKERQARRDLSYLVDQKLLVVDGKGPSRRYVMAG
jgi:predicted HTH transcriptional regulator